jgi:hypothetical protein
MPQPLVSDCGCSNPDDDDALSICVKIIAGEETAICKNVANVKESSLGYNTFIYYNYNTEGDFIYDADGNILTYKSIYATKECCESKGGTPTIYSTMDGDKISNTGYVCCRVGVKGADVCGCNIACKWILLFDPIILSGVKYLEFKKPDGSLGLTTPDGSHCLGVPYYTELAPNITDPYTGEVGVACRLTQNGLQDLATGSSGMMYRWMLEKISGKIKCCEVMRTK